MLLDIGIPCFNEGKYLKRCLENIDKQFSNNYKDIQVWVIDDDSMHGQEYQEIIAQFIQHFAIKYIKMEKNSGPGPCRNIVIKQGVAPWITFVDDDDMFIDNPLTKFDTTDTSIDVINSRVYFGPLTKNLMSINSYWTGCWGLIFNRQYLKTNNFTFAEELGIVGLEDSVFHLFTTVCANNVKTIEVFMSHTIHADSQYHLVATSPREHRAVEILQIMTLCENSKKYKDNIKDYQGLWNTINILFRSHIKQCTEDTENSFEFQNYQMLIHLAIFKTILILFPSSEDIKPYLNPEYNHIFLPLLYCAYHFCEIKDDILWYEYKRQPYLNGTNILPILAMTDTFYMLDSKHMYQELINRSGLAMIKENRKSQKQLPEKYWNF